MKTWQEFENSCYEHLLKEYGDFCSFEQLGKSDSTNSDIKVTKRNKEKFFIETKDNRAQCGQFVLLPDEEKSEFVYSTRNKSNLNKYSQKIIDCMNKHFEVFAQAGTSGKDITISKDVLYGWIKNYYASKQVEFFITKSDKFIIFSLDKFDKYFDVSAKYRIKISGSSNPSKANWQEIKSILSKTGSKFELNSDNGKLYVRTEHKLSGLKIKGTGYTYLFNSTGKGEYNIRKLSNTKNANVIFSISLNKRNQDPCDLKEFENYIR